MATAHLAGRRVVLSVVRGVVVVLESSRAFARGAVRAGHVLARFNKHTAASETSVTARPSVTSKPRYPRKRLELDARFLGNVRCRGFLNASSAHLYPVLNISGVLSSYVLLR